jgi:hypothetical protein
MSTSHDYDTRLLAGIEVALAKARELDYAVETMDVSASMQNGKCVVHFSPVPAPGHIVMGGDLSVVVDPASNNVLEVTRGQ